ncbi:MAG: hypothetical protein MI976_29930, partial [Pseudomonadales bacterium]|nr:hypothetical protein [Pseudomonadales bacterium]
MMIKHKAKLAALLVSITTSGIVGCGGESNSFPELVSISITGTAVKGTLGNTLIVACLATSSDCVSADASTVESTSGFLGQD